MADDLMQSTYDRAMQQVFSDEGGYTNDPHDPGGPTNWGITLEDARHYWKSDATTEDVKTMPKSVAEDIYNKHYALPIHYDDLPAGVDYAVFDYGINSGISRSVRTLQETVGVVVDGVLGPNTLAAVNARDRGATIDAIYNAREAFLKSLSTFSHFGHGWMDRCHRGRILAHTLENMNAGSAKAIPPATPVVPPTQVKTQAWLANILNFLLSFIKGK